MVPRLCSSSSVYIIQGNSIGALFNGLPAELPTIFLTSTTSDYIGMVGSHEVVGKTHAMQLHLHMYIMDPLVLEMAQK